MIGRRFIQVIVLLSILDLTNSQSEGNTVKSCAEMADCLKVTFKYPDQCTTRTDNVEACLYWEATGNCRLKANNFFNRICPVTDSGPNTREQNWQDGLNNKKCQTVAAGSDLKFALKSADIDANTGGGASTISVRCEGYSTHCDAPGRSESREALWTIRVPSCFCDCTSWSVPECPKACGQPQQTIERTRTCTPTSPPPPTCAVKDTLNCEATAVCPPGCDACGSFSTRNCPTACGKPASTVLVTRTCPPETPASCGTTQTATCPATGACQCSCSGWSAFGSCSATCGGGSIEERRTCDPVGCEIVQRVQSCNNQQCPITTECTCGDWIDQSTCSQTCGGGIKTQSKICNGTATGCSNQIRQLSCNTQSCPSSSCQCADWVDDSSCSQTCGGGTKTQRRTCTGSGPACVNQIRQVSCNTQGCSVSTGVAVTDPSFCVCTDWNPAGACSASCGSNAFYIASRMCNSVLCRQQEQRPCVNLPPCDETETRGLLINLDPSIASEVNGCPSNPMCRINGPIILPLPFDVRRNPGRRKFSKLRRKNYSNSGFKLRSKKIIKSNSQNYYKH